MNSKSVVKLFSTALLVVVASQAGGAEFKCGKDESYRELEKLSQTLPQAIGLAGVKNLEEFCRLNGYRDFAESINGFENGAPVLNPLVTWINNLIPSYDTRAESMLSVAATNDYIKWKKEPGKIDSLEQGWQKMAEAIAKISEKTDPKSLEGFERNIAQDQAMRGEFDEQLKSSSAEAGFFCAGQDPSGKLNCIEMFKKNVEMYRPVMSVTGFHLWREVITDPVYRSAFKDVAGKIVGNIQTGVDGQSRLFDHLEEAFFKKTNDRERARDYAWKSMATFATGGSNSHNRLEKLRFKDPQFAFLVFTITNGAAVLDRLSIEKGFLYSYPQEVANTCDHGKPYHFWMTAYLARENAKASKDKNSAAAAAFAIDKAYQFAKTGYGREPAKPFRESSFANYSNNVRIDLVLAGAGAWYGANSIEANPIKISKKQVQAAFEKSFGAVKEISKQNVDPKTFEEMTNVNMLKLMSLYNDWTKIIAPHEAYSHFRQIYEPKK